MRSVKALLIILASPGLLAACSQSNFATAKSAGNSASSTITPVQAKDQLSCLQGYANYQLNTSIDDFELTGGVSGTVGFGNGVLQAISLNVTYSSGELDMSMNLSQPLYSSTPIAFASGSGNTNNFSLGVGGLASLISGSMSGWESTSLYSVSADAISDTFGNLIGSMTATPTWSSFIGQPMGTNEFMINVGSLAGVQVGDQFSVYKMDYVWQGNAAPCTTALETAFKASQTPFATVTVQQVNTSNSLVTVNAVAGSSSTQTVTPEDWIEIHSLVKASNGTPRTTLKYSIQLGTVTQSSQLLFNNGNTTQAVNMTPFVGNQIDTFLSSQGNYYLMQ